MDLSIDKSLASSYVQNNNNIHASRWMPSFSRNSKLPNPIERDYFTRSTGTPTVTNPIKETPRVSPSIDDCLNEKSIQAMINRNPKLKEFMSKSNMEINIENVKDIKDTHLNSTEEYALGIADVLNLSATDKKIISKGAIFHDFGKILIPASLLNKKGELTPEERHIVNLHSKLGDELLKTSDLDPKVLEIVKNHHKSLDKNPSYNAQIVSVADIYSALRTERSYKGVLSHEEAMKELSEYAKIGKINPDIVKALNYYINKTESAMV